MLLSAYGTGFALGLSLILAIGAQNAFVLRQGLLRQHVLLVVLFCASADTLLILAGVAGLSALIAEVVGQYASVLFGLAALWLAGYGVMRLSSAIRASDAISTDRHDGHYGHGSPNDSGHAHLWQSACLP